MTDKVPTFFVAWSQTFSASPIPTQTFSLNIGQERQFVDWYTNAETLAFAKAHPGQLYIIGDEPDQFCQPPAQYAETYHMAVEAIRSVDPTARFSPSGFAEPNSHCCDSEKYDKSWDDAHSVSYAQRFCDEYARMYGSQPPVAEWRFHDFATTVPTGDIETWWARIEKMAAWSIAHGAKMYLGSWGFLGWSDPAEPTAMLQAHMRQMMTRLEADSRIVGAAWWSLGPWEDSTHPLLLDGTLTPLGQTYAAPQTNPPQTNQGIPMPDIQGQVDDLWAAVGMPRASSPRLTRKEWEAKAPWPAVVSGDYNLFDWLRLNSNIVADQLKMIEALNARVTALEQGKPAVVPVAPTPVAVTPLPSAGTIAGLNASQISALNATLAKAVNAGYPIAAERDRVKAELAAGVYSYGDAAIIAAVKLWRYDGKPGGAEDAALDTYLKIIDQRVQLPGGGNSNVTLPAGDPLWKYVSGTNPSTVPSSAVLPSVPASGTALPQMRDTTSVLLDDAKIASMEAQGAQQFDGPVQFNGPVGMGGAPLDGHPLAMRKGGEVIALSKVASASTQNKTGDVWRAGSCSIVNEYDDGSRMIRGGFWHNGILHRVQSIIDIFGFDSAGTVSKSHEDYSQPQVERCQDWIVREDHAAKEHVFVSCRAGWGVRIAASTQTTNNLNENNFDRAVQIIAPLPGAV